MSQFHISFTDTFEQDTTAMVNLDGELPEHFHIWVWDLYYTSTLHALGEDVAARNLRDTLEGWAGTVVGNILDDEQKFKQEGLLTIDIDLKLNTQPSAEEEANLHEVYSIEVGNDSESGWPDIRVSSSCKRSANRMAYSTIALAQFFLDKNRLFAKELPLHILSMRRFFEEERPCTDDLSRVEAPLYALNKAMKLFQDISESKQVMPH